MIGAQPIFDAVATHFHRTTPEERGAVKKRQLWIARAEPGETLATLSQRTSNVWDDALVTAARGPVRLFVWILGLSAAARIALPASPGNLGEWIDPASNDAYDVTEWFAKQPYSNGNIGMWGCSAVGGSQMQAATTRPPSLKAVVPQSAEFEPYPVWVLGGMAAKSKSLAIVKGDLYARYLDNVKAEVRGDADVEREGHAVAGLDRAVRGEREHLAGAARRQDHGPAFIAETGGVGHARHPAAFNHQTLDHGLFEVQARRPL